MNTFFVKVIKQFYLLVDDKHLKDFTKLNIEVKPILEDLHDIYQQLIDHTDLQQIIEYIRQGQRDNAMEYEGVLYRFKYIASQLKELKHDVRHDHFEKVIGELIRLIETQYGYFMSLIKNKDIVQDEHISGSGFLDDIDDDTILRQFKENERYLDIIQNYIAVLQMKSNLVRTRNELKNVNTKRY